MGDEYSVFVSDKYRFDHWPYRHTVLQVLDTVKLTAQFHKDIGISNNSYQQTPSGQAHTVLSIIVFVGFPHPEGYQMSGSSVAKLSVSWKCL